MFKGLRDLDGVGRRGSEPLVLGGLEVGFRVLGFWGLGFRV